MLKTARFVKAAEPCLGDEEIQAAVQVLKSGNYVQGKRVEEFERAFADYIGTDYAVAVNSGTSALHLALIAWGVGPRDKVIVPPLTFFATIEAVLYQYAQPVFVDIDPDTYTLDPERLKEKLGPDVKAVIPVHLFGHPADMAGIVKAYSHIGNPTAIITDCAQAHGATFRDAKVGSMGTMGCWSFYATKNMTTACEGGMITLHDKELADRLRLLRNHAMPDRHTHAFLGYNYRMSEIAAAIGLVQLGKLDAMNARRQEIADYYTEHIKVSWLTLPIVQGYVEHAWFWYPCLVNEEQLGFETQELVQRLRADGVEVRHRYLQPLYHQPVLNHYQGDYAEHYGDCPVAESVAGRIIGLPIHPNLTIEDLEIVCETIKKIS